MRNNEHNKNSIMIGTQPLYETKPTVREWQSLTDEEISTLSLVNRNAHGALTVPEFARAVEKALKEKNYGK